MTEHIDMTVEEVILTILHGRSWGMTYDQLAHDIAWTVIRDANRPLADYSYGPPSSRTLDATLIRMIADQSIDRIYTAPVTFKLRAVSHQRAWALVQELAKHIH